MEGVVPKWQDRYLIGAYGFAFTAVLIALAALHLQGAQEQKPDEYYISAIDAGSTDPEVMRWAWERIGICETTDLQRRPRQQLRALLGLPEAPKTWTKCRYNFADVKSEFSAVMSVEEQMFEADKCISNGICYDSKRRTGPPRVRTFVSFGRAW